MAFLNHRAQPHELDECVGYKGKKWFWKMLMTRSFVLSQSQYGCSVLLMSWSTALSKYEAPQTRISVSVSKLGCRKYYNLVFLRDFFLFFFGGPRYKKCPKKSLAFDTIITFLKTIAKHQIENGEESTCLKSHKKKL